MHFFLYKGIAAQELYMYMYIVYASYLSRLRIAFCQFPRVIKVLAEKYCDSFGAIILQFIKITSMT